jgi:hypothetical protein
VKLISIKIEANLPTWGNLSVITLDAPDHRLRGWKVCVRGPAVFLVSPPGWTATPTGGERPTTGPVTVIEVPRISCVMRWQDADSVDTAQKYDSPPMWTPEERKAQELAELEKATAPGAKK